jgi:glycosyltransferase involved in cell wall biosynthesis
MVSQLRDCEYEYELSVIILAYNHGASISRALQSVIDQETNLPIQVVISDDSSQDNTVEQIEALLPVLQAKFDVCFTCHRSNIGGSANYLYSWQQCKGKFIAYLEGDDRWGDSNHLARSYTSITTIPGSSAVCNGYRKVFPDGDRTFETFSVESEMVIQHPTPSPYFPHMGASVWINQSISDFKEYVFDPYDDNVHFALLRAKGSFVYLPSVSLDYFQTGTGEWTKNSALQKCDRLLRSTERERQMYRDGYVNDLLPMSDNLTQCLYWLYEARDKGGFLRYAQKYVKYSLIERRFNLRMLFVLLIKTLFFRCCVTLCVLIEAFKVYL